MAKYIDKIVVPIKEGSTTTNTTLYLVDGTLASWVKSANKPSYYATEIQFQPDNPDGPMGQVGEVDEALNVINTLFSSTVSSGDLGLSISSNTISLTIGGTATSSITLPVYDGSVT